MILNLYYNIEEAIVNILEFDYLTKIRSNDDSKWINIEDDGTEIAGNTIRNNNDLKLPN